MFHGIKNEVNPISQFFTLVHRMLLNGHRDIGVFWLRFVLYMGLSFCLATVYYSLDKTWADVTSRSGCLFFVISFLTFMAISGFPSFIDEMRVRTPLLLGKLLYASSSCLQLCYICKARAQKCLQELVLSPSPSIDCDMRVCKPRAGIPEGEAQRLLWCPGIHYCQHSCKLAIPGNHLRELQCYPLLPRWSQRWRGSSILFHSGAFQCTHSGTGPSHLA
jgi:hypothetical protein